MGWHPADIRAAVEKRGKTLKDVALAAGIHADACRFALRHRHVQGERALSEFLKIPLWELWPDRWSVHGIRLDHRTKELRQRHNPKAVVGDVSCQKSRAA
ncbi:helix-turn-helix domain-containing protein [Nitrospirillum amazonense]|uniref:helix-turn-helix domain-containing protein n=1 Tax=Nitrospirillum amazonense TaxID=28077 RepID=UPI002412CCEE|nr:helix-turn-helix domain-containing protein [Nitrospirillum amazonense]MDG3439595.1 helix-turn-helix domain-containing protein [Nitrospirillum amazonense]